MRGLVRTFANFMLLTALGCGSSEGSVAIAIWGEEIAEEGIATSAFEDGWSARFDRLLVSIGEVTLATAEAEHRLAGYSLVDLVRPGPHPLGRIEGVAAESWEKFGYHWAPADEATALHPSATRADRDLMIDGGYSVYVEGSAEKDGVEKRFAWGFRLHVAHAECIDVSSGQEIAGVVVGAGGATEAEITVHADHFFYDDLVSTEARLRFSHIAAADSDMDGEVTLAELSALKLADIPLDQGEYGVGASDVNDFAAYLAAATSTLGHFNGEGHCAATTQ